MITINKVFEITGGEAPYHFAFSSNVPCVTFEVDSGTSENGLVENTITFDNELCNSQAVITMSGTDSNGCPFTFTYSPPDLCDSYTLNSVYLIPPYKFVVTASSPGCNTLQGIEWIYDNEVFEEVDRIDGPFSSVLELRPNPNVLNHPDTTQILARGTNCQGCRQTSSYNFNFCTPQAQNFTIHLHCNDNNFQSAIAQFPEMTGCTGITIDWRTVQVETLGFFNTQLLSPRIGDDVYKTNSLLQVSAPIGTTPGTYTAQYYARTTYGDLSSTGIITFVVHPCEGNTIFIPDNNIDRDCAAYPNLDDVIFIPLDGAVLTSQNVDVNWSTFQVLGTPGYASPSITLDTDPIAGNRIAYQIPNPLPDNVTDVFRWTVEDTQGNVAGAATYTIFLSCNIQATAADDSGCVECGETLSLQPLANDLPGDIPLDLSTFRIESLPTGGVVTWDPQTGTLLYTPNEGFIGTDLFTYSISNVFGEQGRSEPAEISVNVICAGFDNTISVCE
jgi:hypothetical protein